MNNEVGSSADNQGDGFLGVIWRRKFLIILPILAGIGIAYRYSASIPSSYRASAKLIIETDRPIIFAGEEGLSVSPIPGPRVIAAQVRGDEILSVAAQDATLQGVPGYPMDDVAAQMNLLRSKVKFEAETDARDSRSQLVFRLHYDSENPELCTAAVNAVSNALSTFYAKQRMSSLDEIENLVTVAKDNLLPELREFESAYQEFRKDSPLMWNASGATVNPHRELLFELQEQRMRLDEEYRNLQISYDASYDAIRKIGEDSQDWLAALALVNQLSVSTKELMPAKANPPEKDPQADETLSEITVEKTLIPLLVERGADAGTVWARSPDVDVA